MDTNTPENKKSIRFFTPSTPVFPLKKVDAFNNTVCHCTGDGPVAGLFTSSSPNYTPDGKLIIWMFPEEELVKRFK